MPSKSVEKPVDSISTRLRKTSIKKKMKKSVKIMLENNSTLSFKYSSDEGRIVPKKKRRMNMIEVLSL